MKLRKEIKIGTAMRRLSFFLLAALMSVPGYLPPARAGDAPTPKYIVVRLDEVRLLDSGDGNAGEIQYLTIGATGNRGRKPIAIQQTTFPMENWYEGEEDGANATFMEGRDLAFPSSPIRRMRWATRW